MWTFARAETAVGLHKPATVITETQQNPVPGAREAGGQGGRLPFNQLLEMLSRPEGKDMPHSKGPL